MAFKISLPFKKETQVEETNYLSLTLVPKKIIASIWSLADEKVQVLGTSIKSFSSIESLIHEAAAAIDDAGKMAKTDVSQAVFGLSSAYFEGKNLSSETAALLKNLADELDLNAQAYVSLASSLNHFIKIKESVTPQAILIGIFDDFTEIHLIKNNEVLKTKTTKYQASGEKLKLLVEQIKTEEGSDLPSRIIIYGIGEDSRLAKELSKEEWKGIFTSLPKISFVEEKIIAEAVSYSQASDVLGHDPLLVKVSPEKEGEKEEVPSITEKSESELTNENMGFIEGEDILKSKMDKIPETEKENINNLKRPEEYAVEHPAIEEPEFPQETDFKSKKSFMEKITTLAWLANFFSVFKKTKSRKTVAISILVLLTLVFIGAFIASRTFASVQVVIKANTKTQDGNFRAAVVKNGTLDASQNTIPGQEVTATADGSQKMVTTGTKNTGDYAKGQVNVFNWTTDPKSFSKNTVIITSGGVKFTLDSDVDVASRSASLPGESQVNVTASDFGTGGNINAGTDFTFQQYDQLLYSAKNDNAFTGGDEKQVTVVSQDDIDKLSKSLLDSLTQKSKDSLKQNPSGQQLQDDAISVTVTKKQFDKNLNDEAALLNLDMSVEAKAIVFSQDDLKNVISQSINQNSQDNLESRPDNIQISQVISKPTTSGLNLTGSYTADLVPKFNDDQLKSQIAGKSTKDAQSLIKQIAQVTDVNFLFSPNFYFFNSLPKNKDKITFKIEKS